MDKIMDKEEVANLALTCMKKLELFDTDTERILSIRSRTDDMKKLKIFNSVTKSTAPDPFLSVSMPSVYPGCMPQLRPADVKIRKLVEQVEQQYGIFVYHVIITHTTIGTMYSMLYVSGETDDCDDICVCDDGSIVLYAYVATVHQMTWTGWLIPDEMLSEFGSITIRKQGDAFVRKA